MIIEIYSINEMKYTKLMINEIYKISMRNSKSAHLVWF